MSNTAEETVSLAQPDKNQVPKPKKQNEESAFKGFAFVIASELFLAISNIFIKKCELFTAMEQAGVRYALQLVSMFILIRAYKKTIIQPNRKSNLYLIARGLLGTASIFATMLSLKLIDPSDTIALVNLNVIFVAFLATRFLKEKLNWIHWVSMLITLIGVVVLTKPNFLFSWLAPTAKLAENGTLARAENGTSLDSAFRSPLENAGGIAFGLLSAFFWASTIILIRKLNISGIHYSVSNIFTPFIALPLAALATVIIVFTKTVHRDSEILQSAQSIVWQVSYMLVGAAAGILQILTYNQALMYQNSTQIAITQPLDLVFGFVLQYLLLGIFPGVFGLTGAALILLGVSAVLVNNYRTYLRKTKNQT